MSNRAVHSFEGMFLSPQHFQAADRHAMRRLQEIEDWYHPFGWGLRSVEFDPAAIANYMVSLQSCEARFPDGTHISIPQDATVAPVELREALATASSTVVYLAVPMLRLGQTNADKASSVHGPRYSIEEEECPDENGSDRVSIEFRRTRVRLMLEKDDRSGYVTIPLTRIFRPAQALAPPQIAPAFVPPVLVIEAWPWLRHQIQKLVLRIRSKIAILAGQMVAREFAFDSQVPGDTERLLKLLILNGIEARLAALASTAGLSPLKIYLELCGFVGQVAIFRDDRRAPELPPYEHENLGPCFLKTIESIQAALEDIEPVAFEKRYFTKVGERVEVRLEQGWLAGDVSLYLGVETALKDTECDEQLKRLHMVVAGAEKVEEYFSKRRPGLLPALQHRVPIGLPAGGDLVYFHFNRSGGGAWSEREEGIWKDVVNSRSLSIRLSLTQADLDQDGMFTLKIKDGVPVRLRFALFVTRAK